LFYGNSSIGVVGHEDSFVTEFVVGVDPPAGYPVAYDLLGNECVIGGSSDTCGLSTSILTESSITGGFLLSAEGEYGLSDCVVSMEGDLSGLAVFDRNNFDVALGDTQRVDYTLSNLAVGDYFGWVDLTCVASINGLASASLDPLNKPVVELSVSVPPENPDGSGTGGSGDTIIIETPKRVCNFVVDPSSLLLDDYDLLEVTLSNLDTVSFNPDFEFTSVDGLAGGLQLSNPLDTVLAGTDGVFGVRYVGEPVSGVASLVISSSVCEDFVVPISVRLSDDESFIEEVLNQGLDETLAEDLFENNEGFSWLSFGLVGIFVFLIYLLVVGKRIGESFSNKRWGVLLFLVLFGLVVAFLITLIIFSVVRGGF